MTCASCPKSITDLVSNLPGVSDVNVSLLSKFATAVLADCKLAGVVVETVENAGYETVVISIEPQKQLEVEAGPYRLTLSVGGMTCAPSETSITKVVSDLDGVSEVTVSLLSNSATVIIAEKDLAGKVLETISDCGFQAQIVNVQAIGSAKGGSPGPRAVSLKIDGMFCQ
jgi:copper chaperone CopZ